MDAAANKLFNVLVVVGASLTGAGCSSSSSPSGVDHDAAADAAGDAADARADALPGISPPPPCAPPATPCDAGSDAYATIQPPPRPDAAYNPDALPTIPG